jgi:hypothetical protein
MLDVRARGGDAARHEELVQEVTAASKKTGVAGDVCDNATLVRRRIEQGSRFIDYGPDHFVLMEGFAAIQREVAEMSG